MPLFNTFHNIVGIIWNCQNFISRNQDIVPTPETICLNGLMHPHILVINLGCKYNIQHHMCKFFSPCSPRTLQTVQQSYNNKDKFLPRTKLCSGSETYLLITQKINLYTLYVHTNYVNTIQLFQGRSLCVQLKSFDTTNVKGGLSKSSVCWPPAKNCTFLVKSIFVSNTIWQVIYC